MNADTPRNLWTWLPLIWSRFLFAGSPSVDPRIRAWAVLFLLVFPAVLLYPCRSFHLLEPDEGRYAQIPREMLLSGDWVVPHLQGEPYFDKPPLLYWLVALSYRLFGVDEKAARLIPALCVHLTILLIHLIGRRSLGERSAFLGALLLTLAPGFLGMGRLLLIDGLLTFLVTTMMLSVFEAIRGDRLKWGWWLTSAVCCGLGVLAKGPIAWILFWPTVFGWRWLSGHQVRLPWHAFAGFFIVSCSITFPWYIAMYLREPAFLKIFLWDHNVVRFLKPFAHLQPVWFYVPVLLLGLMPGMALLPVYVRRLTSGDPESCSMRSPALGWWLVAGGWCVVFFSLSACKLPTYVLPAFPALCLAMGDLASRTRWGESRLTAFGVVAMAAGLGTVHYIGMPWYAAHRSPVGRPEMILTLTADKQRTVVCHPRTCDSVAFYSDRCDLRNFRSRDITELMLDLMKRPRTVVLFTHKHSLESFRYSLPPELRIVETRSFRQTTGVKTFDSLAGDTPWGLCDLAVVEVVPMQDRVPRRTPLPFTARARSEDD